MSISKKAEKKQRVKKAPKERKAKGRKSEQDVKAKITEPSAEAVLQDDGATAGAITVKFERAEIEKALTVACDFIEKKSTMPILAHIYLGITDAGCRIIGTNLDRYWIKVINCKPSGP
ncbi:MAG: hypothetical protein OEV28_13605, partial [Nitrospirota bacterium]|nr:hypothetical protein [Nitrospirota bacterium]